MDIPIITAPVAEFCRLSGFGRSRVYELISAGKLESVLIGKRRLILVDSYRALIEPGGPRETPSSLGQGRVNQGRRVNSAPGN